MLCIFKPRPEIEHRFDVGIALILRRDLAAKVDIVHTPEHVAVQSLAMPAVTENLRVARNVWIDLRDNIQCAIRFELIQMLCCKHLITQILRLDDIEIIQAELGQSEPCKSLCNRRADRATSNDVDRIRALFLLKKVIGCCKIHDKPPQ